MPLLPPVVKPPKPKEIIVPAIGDKSGPTSDVGVDYAWGVENCFRWVNDVEGGLTLDDEKVPVKCIFTDYAYKIPEAIVQ